MVYISGRIFKDTRGIYDDYVAVKILPDKGKDWIDLPGYYLVCCTDKFGEQWFRLDKGEEISEYNDHCK